MDNDTFALRPISPSAAAALRNEGGVPYVADAFPGYPCRQCLQDAAVGEELILVSHDPFEIDSAYRSASPIFLHRDCCEPDEGTAALPEQLTRRQLSVRSFDDAAMMIEAEVIDGTDLAATIGGLFADPNSDHIHVHNASRGCWAVTVERT